jgi:cytochrome c-type biogenesis protein CcmE
MKKKHILALVVALLFIGVAAFALVDNKIDYSDFASAQGTGRRVQVSGAWVKENSYNYDQKTNIFSFVMKDHKGAVMPVKFEGMKPNNFETAPSVVCVGKVENGTFVASDIQTKCPSRYEGSSKE